MRRRHVGYGLAGAALCLGGMLAACGGGDPGEGYVAVGAGEGTAAPVAPSGDIVFVPLDGATPPGAAASGGGSAGGSPAGGLSGAPGTPGLPGTPGAPPADGSGTGGTSGTGGAPAPESPGGATPSAPGTTTPTPAPPPQPPPSSSPAPALLSVGELLRDITEKRWCEKVTVEFRNTGGSPVRSGTVTFETHIIGALGIDWATVETGQPLPAPIAAGATRRAAYTVCVDAWRVPLGMHIETQDARADY
ncbi:hypothetical protein [Streptomyces sp. FIT100]|uniref:hypothetical protein n=1 Tax=Streptomyces sp. FIT100 TaxID=2837956 RepID=UPI0021CA1891|nr:hypothetical protein [Streptomyces sp. FIT100]UUN27872.1 hypothetical protein KK483_16840 [Streptomyces sp. FIT100]